MDLDCNDTKLDSEYINKVEMAQSLLMEVICMKTRYTIEFSQVLFENTRESTWVVHEYLEFIVNILLDIKDTYYVHIPGIIVG